MRIKRVQVRRKQQTQTVRIPHAVFTKKKKIIIIISRNDLRHTY